MANGTTAAASPAAEPMKHAQSWQAEVAAHVANQFDLLNLARIAPHAEDYTAQGGAWMPSVLVHTRDHLHADGNVRVPGIQPESTASEDLPRLASRIVGHLIRMDQLQGELSQLIKSARAVAVRQIESHENILFRGVFIDEVAFVPGECTPYGVEWIEVYVEIRFAVKAFAGNIRNDHATIKVRLGHEPSYKLFTRAIERENQRARYAAPLPETPAISNLA